MRKHTRSAYVCVIFLFALEITGCTTLLRAKQPVCTGDWDGTFASYEKTDLKREERERLQRFFAANRKTAILKIIETLSREKIVSRQTFSGAADIAGFLDAVECLPEIERHLLSSTDWFNRFACANAIDTIDEPGSAQNVLKALEKESHAMPTMMLASYLSRHPIADSRTILERKYREFTESGDETAVMARIFIEDALYALFATDN